MIIGDGRQRPSFGRDGMDSATDLPRHQLQPIGTTGRSVETGKPPSTGRKLNLPGLQLEFDQLGSIQIRNQQSDARKRGIWQLGNFGTGADGAICSRLIDRRGMPHGAGQYCDPKRNSHQSDEYESSRVTGHRESSL
jgi:hypothetical protein